MAQRSTMNQNVALVFCLRIADGIANGIWNLSVLSTYISVLEGSTKAGNAVSCRVPAQPAQHPPRLSASLTPAPAAPFAHQRVGYVQAIQGTALAASAVPGEPTRHRRADS
jgi:hypothetical protein